MIPAVSVFRKVNRAGSNQAANNNKRINMKTNTIKSYDAANERAQSLFESLGITTTISAPMGDVKDEWPNILYNVTFSKGGRNLTTEYRLGVGHVNWELREGSMMTFTGSRRLNVTPDEQSMIYAVMKNRNATFKNKALQAAAAAKLAIAQQVSPKPYEVFAAICEDGLSAHSSAWDDYAMNYGMDTDSIKSKAIYDYCAELYHKVAALIGADNVAELAQLHAEF